MLGALAVSASSAARPAPAKGPCGSRAGTPVQVSHVIWIWFENHAAGEIVANPAAPRTTRPRRRVRLRSELLRRGAPFTAQLPRCHLGRHAGSHRRRPALRTPHPRDEPLRAGGLGAQLRGEHAGAVRPDRHLPLRNEAQPRGVLPRRPRPLSHGRRAARDDEARRLRGRTGEGHAAGLQLRHAESLQRHARLLGGDRRRLARHAGSRRSPAARATAPGTPSSSSPGTRTTARLPTASRCS